MKTNRIDNVLARQKKSARFDLLMVLIASWVVAFGVSSITLTL